MSSHGKGYTKCEPSFAMNTEVKLAMEALALKFMYCVTLNGNLSFASGNATDRERKDVLCT